MDFDGIGRVATNTTLAACAGGLAACSSCTRGRRSGTRASRSTASSPAWSPSPARVTGCHRSAPSSSVPSPAVVMVLGVDLLEWLRIDDPIGAVAVHGVVRHLGHVAAWACSPPAVRRPRPDRCRQLDARDRSLLRRRAEQLGVQVFGSAVVTVVVLVVGLRLMFGVKALGCCGSAKRSSSAVSTSTSTARRRTTRRWRSWATPRSLPVTDPV